MKKYIGAKIEEVANAEELRNVSSNEYGTQDYSIFRNIFDVDSDMWVAGISKVCLEVDSEGTITHQIDCI